MRLHFKLMHLIVLGHCLIAGLAHGTLAPQISKLELIQQPTGRHWRISWNSEPERFYTLERNTSLNEDSWESVYSTIADAAETTFVEATAYSGERIFWRLVEVATDGSPLISEIVAAAHFESGISEALLQVLVGAGSSSIAEVLFIEDGVVLGNATPGPDNTWTFSLPWGTQPVPKVLLAQARATDGAVASSPILRFLLADPSHFIPLSSDGEPRYGEFVGISETGTLEAFLYYPEGLGDLDLKTGAYFVFEEGASLEDLPQSNSTTGNTVLIRAFAPNSGIRFQSAKFHRHALDNNPLVIENTDKVLRLDSIEPQAIADAFATPIDTVRLTFKNHDLIWQSGALTPDGWDNLTVRPADLLIDLPLPLQTGHLVPGNTSEDAALVSFFSGTWSPVSGLLLEIPASQPLRFRLLPNGAYSAEGSLFAKFPDGTRLRGFLLWENDEFEVLFESESTLLDTLQAIRQRMPPAVPPTDSGTNDSSRLLNALTRLRELHRLTLSFDETVRSQIPTENSIPPILTPKTFGGSTTPLWAFLLSTWQSDPSRESLTENELAALTGAILTRARTVESSSTFLPGLHFLRDLYRLRIGKGFAVGATSQLEHVNETLNQAEARTWAQLRRHLTTLSVVADGGDIATVAGLLSEIRNLQQRADATFQSTPDDDLAQFAGSILRLIDPALYSFSEFEVLDHYEASLEVLVSMLKLHQFATNVPDATIHDLTIESPTTLAIEGQFTRSRNGLFTSSGSFEGMIIELSTRARQFAYLKSLGLPKVSSYGTIDNVLVPAFNSSTKQLISRLATLLNSLPSSTAGNALNPILEAFLLLFEASSDQAAALELPLFVETVSGAMESYRQAALEDLTSNPSQSLQQLALVAKVDLLFNRLSTPDLFLSDQEHGASNLSAWQGTVLQRNLPTELVDGIETCLDLAEWMLALSGASPPVEASHLNAFCEEILAVIRALISPNLASSKSRYDSNQDSIFAPTQPPDWAPGGLFEVSNIAGSARLQLSDRKLWGSLSGELRLPILDTSLTIQGLSFSSDGYLDLTAYGQSRLQAATGQGPLVSIMPRRPVHLSLAPNGNFSLEGGSRVTLSDGTTLETFISLDDPTYAFGFTFAGSIPFKLAKELVLLRPSVDLPLLSEYTGETLLATGRFFASLNKGLEVFVGDAPDLPALDDINLGTPPSFQAPVTIIPTDLMGAWLTGISNATLLPVMQSAATAYEDSVKSMQDALSTLDADLEAIRLETETDVAVLKRLRQIINLSDQAAKALSGLESANEADFTKMTNDLIEATEKTKTLIEEKLDELPADVSPALGRRVVRSYLDASGSAALLGSDSPLSTDFIVTKLKTWHENTLEGYGLSPEGSIINQTQFDALPAETALGILLYSLEDIAERQLLGDTSDLQETLLQMLANKVYADRIERLRDAVESNDLEGIALNIIRLNTSIDTYTLIASEPPGGLIALHEELDAARQRLVESGGTPETGTKLAGSLLDAAAAYHNAVDIKRAYNTRDTLIGTEASDSSPQNVETRSARANAGNRIAQVDQVTAPSPPEGSIFSAFWRLLDRSGTTPSPQTKSTLLLLMQAVEQNASALVSDADAVESDLTQSLRRLKEVSEAIALLKRELPDAPETPILVEKFKNTWQALHIRWTLAAEANKTHWLISNYVEHLHALFSNYGNDLGSALTAAYRTATEEAVLSLADISQSLGNIINSIDSESFSVRLPGDIEVNRLSGELAFDRLTGDWQLAFGGKLLFPDIDAFFEIPYGQIQSTGDFSLSLASSITAPFGLDPAFRLAIRIPSPGGPAFTGRLPFATGSTLNGNPTFMDPVLNAFSGTGTLYQDIDDSTTREWSATLSYEQLEPGHSFSVRTSSSAREALLSNEVLLFNGGFGYSLETDLTNSPTQTEVSVQSELGILLRPEAKAIPVDDLTPDDYFLHFSGEAALTLNAINNTARLTLLEGGTLRMPEEFSLQDSNGSAAVTLLSSVVIDINPEMVTPLSFSNGEGGPARIVLDNLGFALPLLESGTAQSVLTSLDESSPPAESVPGFQTGVSTILRLYGTDFPVLERINATLSFAHPSHHADASKRLSFEVTGEDWRIDGIPKSAAIGLADDLEIVDLDGLKVFLMSGSEVGISRFSTAGGDRLQLAITGNLRGRISSALLSDEASNDFEFGADTSASFTWDFVDPPSLELGSLSFSGRMRLGGDGGIGLGGVDAVGIPDSNGLAEITLDGLPYIFSPNPSNPFVIEIAGSLDFANFVALGLQGARLVFDGDAVLNTEPELIVGALGFQQGSSFLKLLNLEDLPANLTAASIALAEPTRDPAQRFDLDNFIITASGYVDISLGDGTDSPRLYGAVENFQVRFPSSQSPPAFNMNAFALTLENLSIGDLGGISGGLMVGNLNNPDELYFAGMAGATFNDVGIKAIVATRLDGLIGLCLDVNAGPVGIPLDGGVLGGVLLTGATGGVSFVNSFSDPCEFKSYLSLDDTTGEPLSPVPITTNRQPLSIDLPRVSSLSVIPWENLSDNRSVKVVTQNRSPQSEPLVSNRESLRESLSLVDCPTGDCPPATLNILCQRHPSIGSEPAEENYMGHYADKIIFKHSSLDKAAVDRLLADFGINPDNLNTEDLASDISLAARTSISVLIPRLPQSYPDADNLNAQIESHLDAFEVAFYNSLVDAIALITGDQEPIDAIYEAAYAGVSCLDLTIVLKGTFSWAPISTVLSATGGATASTTGTAGVTGQINLIGLPVGSGQVYYSLTDSNGQLNPSLCGSTNLGFGPLQLGSSSFSYECENCVTGLLQAMADFTTNLSGELAGAADPIMRAFIANVLGENRSAVSSPIASYFGQSGQLTHGQQFAVLVQLSNLPELIRFYEDNPNLPREFATSSLQALSNATFTLLLDVSAALNPELVFCSETETKLFGLSLTGGQPNSSVRFSLSRDGVAGQVTFSPSHVLLNMVSQVLAPGNTFLLAPPSDFASVGFAVAAPNFDSANLTLLRNDPLAFNATQQEHIFANTQMTMALEFFPFGLRVFNGSGRILLPSISEHPGNPERSGGYPFVRPSSPSVGEIISASVTADKLGDITWKGDGQDLAALFPNDAAKANAAAAYDLRNDYFPHGGFVGQASLAFPKSLTVAPPIESIQALLDESLTLQQRFDAAKSFTADYLTATLEVGFLQFYVPFPSIDPAFWNTSPNADDFTKALSQLDIQALASTQNALFPKSFFFMRGKADLDFMGIPLLDANLEVDAEKGMLSLSAIVGDSSWISEIIQARVELSVQPPAYLSTVDPTDPPTEASLSLVPSERLQNIFDLIANSTETNKSENLTTFSSVIRETLPRASLEINAGLDLAPLLATADLSDLIRFNAAAGLYAFSPFFEPQYATPGYSGTVLHPDPQGSAAGPYTLARRNGGVAIVGSFDLGMNLSDANPANRIEFTVDELSLGFTGIEGASLPAFTARGIVPLINLPNAFAFADDDPSSFRIENGLVAFNSNPPAGSGTESDYLRVGGRVSPLDLGPFLRVIPTVNTDGLLGGTLRITNTGTVLPSATVHLEPAIALLPLLGSDLNDPTSLRGVISGIDGGDFTFSTIPGQPWSARIEINGSLRLKSPFEDYTTAPILLQAAPLDANGIPVPFYAEVEGSGLENFEIRIQIPNGITLELFPETEHASTLTVGSAGGAQSVSCLLINSDGRIYYDSGTQVISIASPLDSEPFALATGRIEFGFEPDGVPPIPEISATTIDFPTLESGHSSTRTVSVTNAATGVSQLILDAGLSDSTHFEVTPHRLILGPGESGNLEIRYTPTHTGTHTANLDITHNATTPGIQIPISGTCPAAPALHVSSSVLTFPDTPLGTPSTMGLTFSNLGTEPLEISNIISSSSIFTTSFGVPVVTGTLSLEPGQSRTLIVKATPINILATSANLSFSTNDPDNPSPTVSLHVQGTYRYWYKQRQGRKEHRLSGVAFNGERGFAGGHNGSLFDGYVSGRAWMRNAIPGHYSLNALTSISSTTAYAAGSLKVTDGSTESLHSLVLKTTDAGANWSPLSASALNRNAAAGTQSEWKATAIIPSSTYCAFAGSIGGNGMISVQTSSTAYQTATLSPNVVPPLHGIAFSQFYSNSIGIAVGEGGTILRSTDDGKSWVQINDLPDGFSEISLRAVAADPGWGLDFVAVGDNGSILVSTTGGLSWTAANSNTTVHLNDIIRTSDDYWTAVGDKGTILRSTGSLWSKDQVLTDEDFTAVTTSMEGMSTYGSTCWAVTRQGSIYHRGSSFVWGGLPVLNIDEDFTDPDNKKGSGEKTVREVRFINDGTASTSVGLDLLNYNASEFALIDDLRLDTNPSSPGTTLTLPTGDSANYGIVFTTGTSGVKGVDLNYSTADNVFVGKTLPTLILNEGRNAYTPKGYLTLPGSVKLSDVVVGQSAEVFVMMKNIGETALELYDVEVEADSSSGLWEATLLNGTGSTMAASPTPSFLSLKFTPSQPGRFEAIVRVLNSSANPTASIRVRALATSVPEQLMFKSNIAGTIVQIDHDQDGHLSNYTLPAVFQLVSHAPTQANQLQKGTSLNVQAPESFTVDGVTYKFQSWQPGSSPNFVLDVGNSDNELRVSYIRSRIANTPTTTVPALSPNCDFSTPSDVLSGPWLKISQARLSLPWLNAANGEDFKVEGGLFLTLQRAYGRLSSSGLIIRVPDQQNLVGRNTEILEITPGAWTFDIDSAGIASFSSLTPGIEIFNQPTLPPALLEMLVDLSQPTETRSARISFATLGDLQLLPGTVALGAGHVALETALSANSASLALSLNSRIKLLADPRSPTNWLIDQPYAFEFSAALGVSPYTFTENLTLFDVDLLRLDAVANLTRVGFSIANGQLSLGVYDLNVSLFDSAQPLIVNELSLQSNGSASFQTTLPESGLNLGFIQLVPKSNPQTSVVLNPLAAILQVQLPEVYANSTQQLWANNSLSLPPLSIDTANFFYRVDMPALNLSGFATRTATQDDDNFVEFSRVDGAFGLKFRNQMDLFIGAMRASLSASENGISGHLSGRVGLEEPAALSMLQASISMQYTSTPSQGRANFELNQFLLGLPIRLQVGSINPPAQACTLTYTPNTPIELWLTNLCFP